MIRRINLFAGAAAGKSTCAAKLFADLKVKHINVELVQEYIKTWAYERKMPTGFDQVYIFGKQLRKEEVVLKNGVDTIITDSPVFLGTCYADLYGAPGCTALREIVQVFDEVYKPLNIFLERPEVYQTTGRYQTHEEAKKIDELVKDALQAANMPFATFPVEEYPAILEYITDKMQIGA